MKINILAVGDIVGDAGLRFLRERLSPIQKLKNIAFTVVNGENAAGLGLTPAQAEDIFRAGADVITLGNHTYGKAAIKDYLDDCPRILRPANYAPGNPGRGFGLFETNFGTICVINLLGRCGMNFGTENPFLAADRLLRESAADITLVDFHAEATSEKLALSRYLDGRAAAVWGTHTHVQTSDADVLPGGTGHITDLGMTGPIHSVLGVRPEQSISLFLGEPPQRHEIAAGACKMECAIFEVETETGRCSGVEALRIQ